MPLSEKTPRRWQFPVAVVLSVLGLGLSLYLTWQHLHVLRTGAASICNFGGAWNCDVVSSGPYSELFEIPVSFLGMLFYALSLAVGILGMLRASYARATHGLLFVLGSVSVLCSLALFGISAFVLRAFCLFCVGLYIVSLGLFFAVLPGAFSTVRELASLGRLLRERGMLLLVFGCLFGAMGSMLLIRQIVTSQKTANAVLQAALSKQNQVLAQEVNLPPLVTADAPSQGNPNAKVTIVEVSDFECPYCQKAAGTVAELQKLYPDKLRVVFRHFPLDPSCNPLMTKKVHDRACGAAKAALCAHKQNKFWEMAHKLFDSGAEDETLPLAKELGLQEGVFSACLQDPKTNAAIVEDIQLAHKYGVRGVPVLFVNGKPIKGAQPIETYRTLIDEELAKN